MDELEKIRQRRMEEMMQQNMQEQAELQQQIAQLEAVVKTLFTKEALQRYGNLKAAHPEKAVQLLALIGQMVQKGNARRINDGELKKVLAMITPKNKEIRITRK